jgi:Rod binding domain-containing protein
MAGIVSLTAGAGSPGKSSDPAKIREAAPQFEALLIGQILHSAHASDTGWLDSGDDSSGSCATDFAEEQLANAIAQSGGFGLAKLITQGLQRGSSTHQTS